LDDAIGEVAGSWALPETGRMKPHPLLRPETPFSP